MCSGITEPGRDFGEFSRAVAPVRAGTARLRPVRLTATRCNLYHSYGFSAETFCGSRNVPNMACERWFNWLGFGPPALSNPATSPSRRICPTNSSRQSSWPFAAADFWTAKSAAAGGIGFPGRHVKLASAISSVGSKAGSPSRKKKASPLPISLPARRPSVWLIERLTDATDNVLDKMTLEQLMEQVSKISNLQQSMYYI